MNPKDLTDGGTLQRGAWVLSDDAKSNVLKLVDWSVDKPQTIQIKSYSMSAWSLSYTGPHRGNLRYGYASDFYSKGSETITYLFDSVYGIRLGTSRSGNYKLDRPDGGFTETYSETMQFDDTNLEFSVPTTSESVQTTGLIGGMRLKVGDWWSIKGAYHWTSTGSGTDSGTWTEDGQYTEKFTVTSLDSNTITISYHYSDSWSSTATGGYIEANGGSTNKDTSTETANYVIDLSSFNVLNATEKGKNWIGYPTMILVNPAGLQEGATVQRGWWMPSNDAKSDAVKLVTWSVGTPQTIPIKGQTVNAWSLSYTGQRLGYWYGSNSKVYPTGPQTDTRLYDSIYGIFVGISSSGEFRLEKQNGGWTETYSETSRIDDTNLAFSVPTTEVTPFFVSSTSLMAIIGLVAIIAIVGAWLVMRSRNEPRPESAAEKFCIECGKPLTADQKYCAQCGKAQN